MAHSTQLKRNLKTQAGAPEYLVQRTTSSHFLNSSICAGSLSITPGLIAFMGQTCLLGLFNFYLKYMLLFEFSVDLLTVLLSLINFSFIFLLPVGLHIIGLVS